MKEHRIREEQNKNKVNDTNEKLLLQMQQGQNLLSEAYKQVQLAKKSVSQAEENLRVNQNNYDAGMVNVSDVLDAQAQLQQSHNAYTDAFTQYRIAKVNYLQVTGRYACKQRQMNRRKTQTIAVTKQLKTVCKHYSKASIKTL